MENKCFINNRNEKTLILKRFCSPQNLKTSNYIFSKRKFSPRNNQRNNIKIQFDNSKERRANTFLTNQRFDTKKSFENFFKNSDSNINLTSKQNIPFLRSLKKNSFINSSRNFEKSKKRINILNSKKFFERSAINVNKKNIKICRSFENINRHNIFSNDGKSTKYESKVNFSNKNKFESKIRFVKNQNYNSPKNNKFNNILLSNEKISVLYNSKINEKFEIESLEKKIQKIENELEKSIFINIDINKKIKEINLIKENLGKMEETRMNIDKNYLEELKNGLQISILKKNFLFNKKKNSENEIRKLKRDINIFQINNRELKNFLYILKCKKRKKNMLQNEFLIIEKEFLNMKKYYKKIRENFNMKNFNMKLKIELKSRKLMHFECYNLLKNNVNLYNKKIYNLINKIEIQKKKNSKKSKVNKIF